VSGVDWKEEEEEASSSSPKRIIHPTNTLEDTLNLLKCKVNEHVFMNLVRLNKNFNPHYL
jgi:retron-type reverse transcriptase